MEQIAIDSIKAFHNHPFHLYEGERLNDMDVNAANANVIALKMNFIDFIVVL